MQTLLTVLYIFAMLALIASIVILLLRANHNKMTYCFIGVQGSLILWVVSQLLVMNSVNLHQLSVSYDIGNLGICFIGSFWLLFALYYYEKQPKRITFVILFAVSAFFFISVITNERHHLYYDEFTMNGVEYAPFFFVNQAFIYLCMLSGIVMVCRQCFENRRRSRGQAVLISFAAALPLALNLLTLAGAIKLEFALTPLSFALSSVLVLLATFRYGFLNVNAIAFEDAFNSMEEGVTVFNRRGDVTYMSYAARKLLGISDDTDYPHLIRLLSADGADLTEDFISAEIVRNNRTLSLKRYSCRDEKGTVLAYTLIVSDITHYYELLDRKNDLAAAEQKLALERERNRIAQEVHDTAGHTLTMITSLARLSKMTVDKLERSSATEELARFADETESLSRSGITQLRCSINNLRDDSFLTSVTQAVRTLTDSVRDMEVDLCIQGADGERYDFCIRAVYDTCRELITNCVRYAHADRMDIIIKLREDMLELYVFDNGIGCSQIKANNGLRGISERIEGLGGTTSFNSSEGNGFGAIIKIPVPEK